MGRTNAVLSLVALAALSSAAPAAAALGEPESSIAADEAALAARRTQGHSTAGYQVVRLVSPARTVREYVTPSGKVFAVAWEGVSHPDLSVLLGGYAPEMKKALATDRGARSRRAGRRVEAGGAVVETWGRQRALRGRAWVPALVPAGVALDEIR